MPELFSVPAGGLDDPELIHAGAVTYRLRALTWDPMDPGLAAFDTMPSGG